MNLYSLIVVSCLIFLIFTVKKLNQEKIEDEKFWQIVFITFIASILGAKIFHILENINFYFLHPNLLEISRGYSILGAITFGFITINFLEKKLEISLREMISLVFLILPMIQAFGRIGNITNNELLPFSYYEMVLNMINFVILYFIYKKERYLVTYYFFLNYGIIRVLIEVLKNNFGFLFYISFCFMIYGFLNIFKLRYKV
jgi:prolipoprotein diacylglyceryltransferase